MPEFPKNIRDPYAGGDPDTRPPDQRAGLTYGVVIGWPSVSDGGCRRAPPPVSAWILVRSSQGPMSTRTCAASPFGLAYVLIFILKGVATYGHSVILRNTPTLILSNNQPAGCPKLIAKASPSTGASFSGISGEADRRRLFGHPVLNL